MKVDIKKVRRMLLGGCRTAFCVPMRVSSYSAVIGGWRAYCEGSLQLKSSDANLVEGIFEYHRDADDHIILYHGADMPRSLLLCKTGGRYAHISVPCGVEQRRRGFIAVYC
jgi:hypothetical protein